MQNISEKIPSIALAVLMVITLILCGLFYAGGTESVECTSGSFDAPTHTDSMINWIYVLIIVTGIATLGLAGLSFIIKIKKDPKSVIVPTAAMIFLVFSLLYTPCIAAIAAVNRELGKRWAILVVILQCGIAWVVAFIVRLLGIWVVGIGLLIIDVIMIIKNNYVKAKEEEM